MSISIWQLVLWFVIWPGLTILYLWPIGRILRRMGFSPLLAIAFIIPLVNLVGFWVIAYAGWSAAATGPKSA